MLMMTMMMLSRMSATELGLSATPKERTVEEIDDQEEAPMQRQAKAATSH